MFCKLKNTQACPKNYFFPFNYNFMMDFCLLFTEKIYLLE